MAWTPLLLALLSHCTGSLSQPVLTQPPSLTASPGASASLPCTLSSGAVVAGYHIVWYQQNPGSPPRYLLRFKSDSDKHQGSGVPSRFSGSKDTSANVGLLLISGLQPEDEADYYCATYHGNSGTHTAAQGHGEVSLKPSGPGVRAGLTQEASLSGSLGQKVTLTCKGDSNNVGARNVGWYQQVTGGAPKTVMLGSSRPSGIPDRFSGSKSGNTASLDITGLQPEDEAIYFCASWDYGISNHTVLHPNGELRQKPALVPLIAHERRETEAVAVAEPTVSHSECHSGHRLALLFY
ncbi:hypothetical protein QTO34_011900 [Cnephaeus nilssonii]|uniref:Ig-like domain-containing protein n=1 Tax=Cnephaeus nilssonii TaxID=3371016 RepID=A0AA40HBP7_CNENI|nr:hypothetical protein QTO34_011900 [Eptesicus nilssonii]